MRSHLLSCGPSCMSVVCNVGSVRHRNCADNCRTTSSGRGDCVSTCRRGVRGLVRTLRTGNIGIVLYAPAPCSRAYASNDSSGCPNYFRTLRIYTRGTQRLTAGCSYVLTSFGAPVSRTTLCIRGPSGNNSSDCAVVTDSHVRPNILNRSVVTHV